MSVAIGIVVLSAEPAGGGSIRRMLLAEGHEVALATDKARAAALMQNGADLLIADESTASLSVARELAASSKAAPEVVLVSDSRPVGDLSEGEFVLIKPVLPASLLSVVRGVALRRDALRNRGIMQGVGDTLTHPCEVDAPAAGAGMLWQRRLGDGTIEMGIDVRHLMLTGRMVYVDFVEAEDVSEGQPFARLLVGDGNLVPLVSPVSARVVGRNTDVNGAMCVLAREVLTEDWMLWLVRVRPAA